MKKSVILLFVLLPMLAMAQVVEVNVSALSEKGSNERVGVVLKKDAETDEFYNLAVELKNHSDKVNVTNVQKTNQKNKGQASSDTETLAKLEEARKMGFISGADIQKIKAQMSKANQDVANADRQVAQMASGPGSSNPSALKERIRSYCVGKRFYWSAEKRHGMVVISDKKADGKIYIGIIDATTGRVLIDPDRFDAISAHKEHGYFTKEGYAIAGWEGKSVLINRSGRIILNGGYDNLSFYNDCRMLKARKADKVGIVDYQGNVLEPFVHNSFESESLQKAANRIFKEKGGEMVEIW